MESIGQNLFHFQAALQQSGSTFEEYLRRYYCDKWISDSLYAALSIRTTLVDSMHRFLVKEGLLNLERIQLSPFTDPLAHDVESIPTIVYKGHPYVTTHSMIYAKFLACHNKRIKGIFVDSPNIRLEIEDSDRNQRGKYLIDFSQMDLEIRRNRGLQMDDYLYRPEYVSRVLSEDVSDALDLFERMIVHSVEALIERNEEDLKCLGVAIEIPSRPFPRFRHDLGCKKYGRGYEVALGRESDHQFFWITGIRRENYDLIFPYLTKDGKVNNITSDMIYNYDLCAKSILRRNKRQTAAVEILSGGIREWLYPAIVERLIDNKIISERPVMTDGNIQNIEKLQGYGPFLMVASFKDGKEKYTFPETYGGGIGIERTIYALCRGPRVGKIEDVTCFGKNPDSQQIFLF